MVAEEKVASTRRMPHQPRPRTVRPRARVRPMQGARSSLRPPPASKQGRAHRTRRALSMRQKQGCVR